MTAQTPTRTLQDVLDSVPNLVDYLYSNRKGSVLKDAVLRQPTEFVAPEFTTWRDEQRAWREGIAFYDQSFHMTTTYLRGPDAQKLLSSLAVNSFETFGVGRSRHLVVCSPDGYLMGDGILYSVAPEEMVLVGRAAGHNWVRFNAETGDWDVSIEADEIFSHNAAGRRTVYRYQLEGPHAPALIEQLTGAPLPDAPWSEIFPVTIAGHHVWAQRHTMAGNPGCEFFGPWDEGPAVKEAILTAGAEVNLRRVGSLAYFTNALELGWIPRPVPAIFTGDELRPFREWLPATSEEVTWAIGGSFNAPEIQDYYFTPRELGYGNVIKFDHDFVGREALERTAGDDHQAEGDAGVGPRGRWSSCRVVHAARAAPGALHGVPAGDVLDMAVRRGPRRPGTTDRGLDLHRRQLERAGDALARGRRARVRQARDTRVGHLGRTGRRRQEPLVGAPPPDGDPRHGRSGSDREEVAGIDRKRLRTRQSSVPRLCVVAQQRFGERQEIGRRLSLDVERDHRALRAVV